MWVIFKIVRVSGLLVVSHARRRLARHDVRAWYVKLARNISHN